MKSWVIDLLVCFHCRKDTQFELLPIKVSDDEVIEGNLLCPSCKREYPIASGIPRFVDVEDNYAENFGYQWRIFRTTQIDRFSGRNLSGSRLLNDTRWSPDWMNGKLILDAGCGAGRFADELAQRGAFVVACDISSAVDPCKKTVDDPTGYSVNRGDVAVIQADLMAMPFKSGVFDAIHCAGVIQHTSNPTKVMRTLPDYLKSKGQLFYNFYEIYPSTKFQIVKYMLRQWTPNWKMRNLVVFSRWMCLVFFVPSWVMSQIPVVRFFNKFLPICSVHPPDLPLNYQFKLTLLDTIDWYGPRYEIRQNHKNVALLLVDEGMVQVESAAGLAWAVKP